MSNAWILRPLPIAAATSGATSAGEPLHVANDYLGVVWRSTAAAPVLELDLGADRPVDTLMLFGVALAAATATLAVSGRTAAAGAGGGAAFDGGAQPLYASDTRLVNGRGVALWSQGTPVAVRYLRLAFAGTGGALEIGRGAAGARVALARNFAFGGARGVRPFGKVDFSDRGNLLRRRGRKLRTLGLSFDATYRDEVEAAVLPLMEQVGNEDPVAIVTDPDPHPMRERRCYFGPLLGDLGTIQRNAVGHQWNANLVSLA